MATPVTLPSHPTLTKDVLDVSTRIGTIVKRFHEFNEFAPGLATHPDNLLLFQVPEDLHEETAGRAKKRLEDDFKFGDVYVLDIEHAKPPAMLDAFNLALRSKKKALIFTKLNKYCRGFAVNSERKEAENKLSDLQAMAAAIRDSHGLIVMALAEGTLPSSVTEVPVVAWDDGK